MEYQLSEFLPGNIYNLYNRYASLLFTKNELLRSTFTVGRKSYKHVFWHHYYSRKEIEFRINMLEAFIDMSKKPLTISPTFSLLDPSEKSGINYFLASVFTKLYSEKILNTKYLMHLDVYEKNIYNDEGIKIELRKGQKRPDFVGYNSDGWNAIESKGRIDKDNRGLNNGLEQVKNLKEINGEAPNYKIVMMMYQESEKLNSVLLDPEETKEYSIKLKVDLNEFIYDYYSNILLLLNDTNQIKNEKIENIDFIYVDFICNKYIVGLAKELFDQLKAYNNFDEELFNNKLDEIVIQTSKVDFIGNDGIIFKENI
ncbi:hypothetical protein [Salisediminibacterium halotolerans]|uniref:Uncharacterized protein n=1 Tax=Salisediminibacterium halotolerans TaxID=517425 RepID=A0A1H9TRS8_9BACI|nr:hypothetical protein [Salisediminibacterium haloalkalitolerans]SER99842.1 hypothetical protein SAMN05444126_1114 [Salisediminibacterium haloalkalitolerans]